MSLTYESFDSKWLDLHIDKQATVCFYQGWSQSNGWLRITQFDDTIDNTVNKAKKKTQSFAHRITTLILESRGHACDNEIIWPWRSEENRTFVTWLGKLILSEFRQYKNTTAKGLIITKNYYNISFLASGYFHVLARISVALLSMGKFERHLVA